MGQGIKPLTSEDDQMPDSIPLYLDASVPLWCFCLLAALIYLLAGTVVGRVVYRRALQSVYENDRNDASAVAVMGLLCWPVVVLFWSVAGLILLVLIVCCWLVSVGNDVSER